jgi:hypothetical protein
MDSNQMEELPLNTNVFPNILILGHHQLTHLAAKTTKSVQLESLSALVSFNAILDIKAAVLRCRGSWLVQR